MSDKPWKKFERDCAALIGGKRFWANAGERLDVESDTFRGQCKLVQRLSLAELTALAEEMAQDPEKFGVVFTKLRAGKGRQTPILVTMTAQTFSELLLHTPFPAEHVRETHALLDNLENPDDRRSADPSVPAEDTPGRSAPDPVLPGPDPVLPGEGLRGGAPSEAEDEGGVDRAAPGERGEAVAR